MNDENTYRDIERYLAGEMDGPARSAFEQRLAAEPQLAEELALHRDIEGAFADPETMAFSALVADVVGGEAAGESAVPKKNTFRIWAVAAAVLLLAVVGFFVFQGGPASPESLFADNFTAYEAPANFRSEDPVLEAALQAAFTAYNNGNYADAQQRFGVLYAQSQADRTVSFYYGLSALANDQASTAIAPLQELADQAPHSYRSQARWYLALAHLAENQVDSAKARLESLAASPGKYQAPAQDLLEELE